MGDQAVMGPEQIVVPPCGLDYEKRMAISEFKGLDWKKDGTKELAVQFSRATGFKETGMSVGEVALLYDCLELMGPGHIVELGRNYGTSTRLFIQHVLRHGGSLESWDLKHWDGFLDGMEAIGYSFMERNGAQDYELVHVDGAGGLPEGAVRLKVAHSITTPTGRDDRFVKFLLIDTEHGLEHALGEYMRWREYLQSGAYVAFHDFGLPAVARAVELVKEVELSHEGRISKEFVMEQPDGFGISVLRWGG